MMMTDALTRVSRRELVFLTALCAGAALLLLPSTSGAQIMTFGSPLAKSATITTTDGLGYFGTYTYVPPSSEAPTGVVHTAHWGADTALWNVRLAGAQARAPATGQALKVRVEGCAVAAPGGPPPLRQIHLQDITPLPGGGARVNLTSQAFDLPVCGHGGASDSTISTYRPINLCVGAGNVVALNDDGGFVERFYRAGVPYQVIGASAGSTLDSFIRDKGTGDGVTLAATDRRANDGFASNQNEEVMLQTTLGTRRDATHICAGGTAGEPRALAPLRISPQTDGVNHSQVVAVAIYCRPAAGCSGTAMLGPTGREATYARASFSLAGDTTSHLPLHISSRLMSRVRSHHGAAAVLTLASGSRTFTQAITIKIF
jgi:hypothetical protein